MSEACARAILRIIAVVVVLIGIVTAVSVTIPLVAASRAVSGGISGEVAFLALATPLVVLVEGFLLFAVSPAVARRVVQP